MRLNFTFMCGDCGETTRSDVSHPDELPVACECGGFLTPTDPDGLRRAIKNYNDGED